MIFRRPPLTPLEVPYLGLSDNESFEKQPPLTTPDAVNVTCVDDRSGRKRLARRPGLVKFCSTAIVAATKVKRLATLTYDQNRTLYAAETPGSEPTKWSTATPTKTDSLGVVIDRQSNVYVLNGPASITKYNSDGVLLFTLVLPVSDPLHVVRALWVDEFDHIYAGVSSGGQQALARAWCYTQGADNTFAQLWELNTGNYFERIKTKKNVLYTAQNRVDREEAYIVAYEAFDTSIPIESFRKEVSYPLNDMDPGIDGSVFIASPPNPRRGLDPKAADATPRSVDWQWHLSSGLANFNLRVWSWLDASWEDSFFVTRLPGATSDEGASINVWYDRSGKGRHLYPQASPATAPTLRLTGIGGLPSVHFNGSTDAMESDPASSTNRHLRHEQLTLIPTYSGAQFAVFILFRAGIDATKRWLLGIGQAGTSADRHIDINREPADAFPGTSASGCCSLYETNGVASDTGQSVTPAPAPTSVNGHPLPGSMGPNGMTLVTWICDGGVHDLAGAASRSVLRINGEPVDRWQSATFSSLLSTWLGNMPGMTDLAHFAGDIAEFRCLSDWDNADGVRQVLITAPSYPDANWATSSNTEVEQIEGEMMHKWGAADRLPGGKSDYLTCTAIPGNNETVTIDGVVYTFKTALTAPPVAREVLIGGTVQASLENLRDAINNTGIPGVQYGTNTVAHPTYFALSPIIAAATVTTYRMQIKARSPNAAAVAVSETLAAGAWTNANTQQNINAAGGNESFYPHPYYLIRVYNSVPATVSVGGPPQASGGYANPSQAALLNSVYGILAKIDAANGIVKWVLTSDYDQTPAGGFGVGGVGYAVAVASTGEVFSVGPRQAVLTTPRAILADALDVRKVLDLGANFSTSPDAWADDPGAFTYQYPRIAVDRFDNVYVPIFNAGGTTTVIGYAKAGNAGADVKIVTINNLTSDPQAHAVAVDPNNPTYQATTPPNRAQHIVIATRNGGVPTFATIYKMSLVATTLAAGSNRSMVNFGIAGGDIKIFSAPSTVTTPTGGASALDSGARYVDWFAAYGEAFFTDGKTYRVYNPIANAVIEWKSRDAGRIPQGCKLATLWRGRAVLARDANDPHNWHMAQFGNPYGWNQFPAVQTSTQAISGNNARAGTCPDIVNALISYSDDFLIFGCDHSIWMLNGDPMAGLLGGDTSSGGSFFQVSKVTGIAFGKAWCLDPEGNIYFFGSRGGIWVMRPGTAPPENLTENTIDQRLAAVDLGTYRIELEWDDRRKGLKVIQVPYGVGGLHVKHWFFSKKTGAYEEEFGTASLTSLQPTCMLTIDGDEEDDRVLLVGCEDGFVRFFDATSNTGDDGSAMISRVLLGPYMHPELELRINALWPVLAKDMGDVNYRIYASDTPDDKGMPKAQGEIKAGRNPRIPARARGSYLWLELTTYKAGPPWAVEGLQAEIVAAGRKRVRA